MKMSTLTWNETYALHIPAMDKTHQEFVELLAQVQQAADADLLDRWRALIAHTQVHFDTENAWMQATRFAAGNCHNTQHDMVLKIMREGLHCGTQLGQLGVIRQMADELTVWFPHHADSMDAALAQHLQTVGFDTQTGHIAHPHALPEAEIHGCGGDVCSEAASPC